jgi:Skp family chaperone for outer membrane proteins
MKVFRIIVALAVISGFAILVHTQTRPAGPQTVPASGPASVAVIDSSFFGEDKVGITRVTSAMNQIETKYQPLRTELRGMSDRLNTMKTDLQKKQATQNARLTQQQMEEASRLELQIKRKTEDAQSNYQKDTLAALEPIQKEIGEALVAYAKSKGISVLIDVNRVPVVYASATVNITKDFITEYNRTHPATGARP